MKKNINRKKILKVSLAGISLIEQQTAEPLELLVDLATSLSKDDKKVELISCDNKIALQLTTTLDNGQEVPVILDVELI